MSKEEFLKIQTCTLKVNIHCDGCKRKVKKVLRKIEGVYTVSVDAEQGMVIVLGNVDPSTLIKKLAKSGKPAHIWGAPKQNQQMNDFLKNMQFDGGNQDIGENIKNQRQLEQKDGANGGQVPKQPQDLEQIKRFHNLKLAPERANMKQPESDVSGGGEKDKHKSVKSNISESDDDEFDDAMDYIPIEKPIMVDGDGGGGSTGGQNNNGGMRLMGIMGAVKGLDVCASMTHCGSTNTDSDTYSVTGNSEPFTPYSSEEIISYCNVM